MQWMTLGAVFSAFLFSFITGVYTVRAANAAGGQMRVLAHANSAQEDGRSLQMIFNDDQEAGDLGFSIE
jgi:hypothetical protein